MYWKDEQNSVVTAVTEHAKEACMPRVTALTKPSGQERLPGGGAAVLAGAGPLGMG